MRVLHLIPSISPLRGGPSQAVLAMTATLRREGVDAEILTTNDAGPGTDPSMPLGEWFEREGVPVLAFPRWKLPFRPLREFAFAPGLTAWLRRHGQKYQLLHVHALFSYPSTAGMAVARQIRLPYILRTIGQLNHWSLEQSALRKRVLLEVVERANIHGAAALHFTSASEAAEALDARPALGLNQSKPHFVLPLGVTLPEDRLVHRQKSCTTNFLFLSRLHPKKRLPQLFQALDLLNERQPTSRWRLQIAGDGDSSYLKRLQSMALSLGISDHVHWMGFVMGAAKQQLLQQADWFVLPSASENFGIAAAEALAAGTPVILSPGVALAAEVASAGAGWCCASDPQDLAAQLARCLEPPPLEMRRAARRLATTTYSWEAIGHSLSAQYRTVLAL